MLAALGHEVVRTRDALVDLTLLDLSDEPELAGHELRILIEDPSFAPAQALVVVPEDQPRLELAAVRAGFEAVLRRPLTTMALQAALNSDSPAPSPSGPRSDNGPAMVLVVADSEARADPCQSALGAKAIHPILAQDAAEFERCLSRVSVSAVVLLASARGLEPQWICKKLLERRPRTALLIVSDSPSRDVPRDPPPVFEYCGQAPDPSQWADVVQGLLNRRRDHFSELDLADQIAAKQRELQRINETLRTVNRAMRDTNRRLEEQGHIKDELIGIAAHELKSPLAAMAGAIDILGRGIDRFEPQDVQLLELLSRNNRRMIKLVNDILDLSRLEAGRIRLQFEGVSPLRLVELAISTVTLSAQAKGIRFDLEVDVIPDAVYLDSGRVVQMLVNLTDNAVKFSPTESIITIRVKAEGDRIHFVVADAGPGIPEEERRWVFERFHHRSRGLELHSAGSGLGLTITRALAEYHGGSVQVGESPDGGARLTLSLPIRPRAEA